MVDTGNRKGAAIFRYSQKAQSILGEQLKAEPWMHLGILTMKDGRVLYGIYIWDTRKVLSQGETTEAQLERIYKSKPAYATDNHELLKGRGEFVDEFNNMFGYTQAYKQRKRDAAKARREANLREVPKTYAPYRLGEEAFMSLQDAQQAANRVDDYAGTSGPNSKAVKALVDKFVQCCLANDMPDVQIDICIADLASNIGHGGINGIAVKTSSFAKYKKIIPRNVKHSKVCLADVKKWLADAGFNTFERGNRLYVKAN